ncbi:glycosyltransferase [Paenibacillus sp. EZ-K15]|uniref:glycosyltransferase n=1 Tax=Paenibacillus sp. EZ-K15 TaxID=2044275 RepID=UPI000BF7EF0F|nr:glycosyltransferase [Paenibacillus sp. EZ-K15]
MIIFTSICANYVHKARTLAKSVKENIPDATFIVCLTEREVIPQVEYQYFDRIVLSKDAWEGNFNRFIFKHTIVEASTSVKGQFFRYLYNEFPDEDKFIYLDPDIYVYSDFTELRSLLDTRPIVLCPHLLEPGNIDMELSSTAHGVYNLGFLGVNRSQEAQSFINWWAERLYLYCYDDIQNGVFTDQKWIDLAPCFFDVEIFKHRGYDFAPWSLLNCNMIEENGKYYIKGDPIRFIHFSGYGDTAQMCMRKWLPEGDHPFKKLYSEYSEIHDANNADAISKTTWTYSSYTSGEKIEDSVRYAYRKDYDVMFSVEDPFEFSNEYFNKKIGNLTLITKSSGVISKSFKVIRTQGFKAFFRKVYKKISSN